MDYEEFERLNPEEQERIFHQTSFREKGDLLLHSYNPLRLAQSLSQEELYLVTREMDLEERSEILRYANLSQLFFISDIDCWKKDRLNPKGFVRWLETLQEADEQRLLAWLVEMDYEAVVTGFRGLIQVLKPEWEYPSDELLGDQPYFTLDERYFISVKEENLETVRRAIEILFENHRGRYIAMLEGLIGELDYELEEEAFQNRSRRLAERGFPDPETAHHIYRLLSKEEYEKFSRKNGSPRKPNRDSFSDSKAPHYLVLQSRERVFLDEVLLLFREGPPEVREGLEEELAWLSNKIIACEGIDFASEEKVRRGVERARNFVSVGLEDLSNRDPFLGRQILEERWLEIIFRWGITRLAELREEAGRIVENHWGGARKAFLEFLDPPYESIFQGVFRLIPQYYDPLASDSVDSLRDFRSTEEVETTRRAILQISQVHESLNREFPTLIPRLNLEMLREASKVTLFSLWNTIFVSFTLQGKVLSHPISERELTRFLEEGFEAQGSRRVLIGRKKERFLNRFFPGSETEFLKPFWSLVLQRLEEELGRLDPTREIDSRFITSVYLAKRRERQVQSRGLWK